MPRPVICCLLPVTSRRHGGSFRRFGVYTPGYTQVKCVNSGRHCVSCAPQHRWRHPRPVSSSLWARRCAGCSRFVRCGRISSACGRKSPACVRWQHQWARALTHRRWHSTTVSNRKTLAPSRRCRRPLHYELPTDFIDAVSQLATSDWRFQTVLGWQSVICVPVVCQVRSSVTSCSITIARITITNSGRRRGRSVNRTPAPVAPPGARPHAGRWADAQGEIALLSVVQASLLLLLDLMAIRNDALGKCKQDPAC